MIASLKGTLRSIGKTDIILEVNGVGYLLNVSSRLISSLESIGSKLELFTDLQVKDDKIVMYGFTSLSDQNFFKLLQSVQGVGPKAAISILSTLIRLAEERYLHIYLFVSFLGSYLKSLLVIYEK